MPRSFACFLSAASLASSSAWPERDIHTTPQKQKVDATMWLSEVSHFCSVVTHGRLLRASTAPCPVAMVSSTTTIFQGIPRKSGHELSPKRTLYVPRPSWQTLPVEDRAPSPDGTGQALKMSDMPMHLRCALRVWWFSEYLCDRQHCRACMTTLCVERQRLEIYRVAGWIDQRHIRALCCNRKHTAIQPESVLLRKLSRKLAGQRTQSATTWPLVQDEFAITTSARRPTSP